MWEQLKGFTALPLQSQGQNLGLTVSCVPCSLDSGWMNPSRPASRVHARNHQNLPVLSLSPLAARPCIRAPASQTGRVACLDRGYRGTSLKLFPLRSEVEHTSFSMNRIWTPQAFSSLIRFDPCRPGRSLWASEERSLWALRAF